MEGDFFDCKFPLMNDTDFMLKNVNIIVGLPDAFCRFCNITFTKTAS